MNDQKKPPFSTKQVPVMNRQTGETKLVDAPVAKQKPDQPVDEANAGEPTLTRTFVSEVSSVTDMQIINGEKNADRKDKSKKKKIESCDEYLKSYYEGKIKLLSEETIRNIGVNASVSSSERAQLIDDAVKADFSLENTRQLFVLSLNVGRSTNLAKSLREFAKDVVCRHPVMGSQDRESWFPNSSNNDDTDIKFLWSSFAKITARPMSEESGVKLRQDQKKDAADLQKARINAFLSAIVWRYAEQQTNFREFFRSLRATIFQSKSESKDLEKNLLGYLVSVQDKDRSNVADFARWYYDQTIHAQNQADHYRQSLESLQNKKQEVVELLAAKEEELERLNQQLAGLRVQIQSSEEQVRITRVHSKDDLERQASRTIRALEDEIPVLTDCLTALNRDPPKVEVAKEYLGTALDTLNNELKILREK